MVKTTANETIFLMKRGCCFKGCGSECFCLGSPSNLLTSSSPSCPQCMNLMAEALRLFFLSLVCFSSKHSIFSLWVTASSHSHSIPIPFIPRAFPRNLNEKRNKKKEEVVFTHLHAYSSPNVVSNNPFACFRFCAFVFMVLHFNVNLW